MGRTGKVDGVRVVAWTFALGAHLMLLWLATRKIAPPEPASDARSALRLVWLEPAKSVPSVPAPAAEPPPSERRPAPTSAPRPPTRATPAPEPAAAAAPGPGKAMSAVFIEQARQLSDIPAGGAQFVPDPLAHRDATLPGSGGGRFRMRAPPSIRRALLKIGTMAGGPGYTTDPCARIAGNLGELSQLGDSELLQEELRRKRALCD